MTSSEVESNIPRCSLENKSDKMIAKCFKTKRTEFKGIFSDLVAFEVFHLCLKVSHLGHVSAYEVTCVEFVHAGIMTKGPIRCLFTTEDRGKDRDLLWTTYVLMEFQGIMSRKSTEGVR